MNDFEGKVVLITGAGKGVGRELAQVFAARGARVAANDISPVNLDQLVQAGGGKIRPYVEDVAKKIGIQSLVNQVEDDLGRIDVLVNHAAVEPRVPLLDMDDWDWHRVLDVNLTGAFLAMQSVGRVMRQNGSGVILNLIGMPAADAMHEAAYVASMYGLIALTQAAAREMKPYGILVHAVGHGIEQFQVASSSIPSDLTGAVLHLCNSSLSGQIINLEDA